MPLRAGISPSSVAPSDPRLTYHTCFYSYHSNVTTPFPPLLSSIALFLLLQVHSMTCGFHPGISSFTCCHFHITDHHLCHIRTTLQLSTLIFFPQILTSNLFLPIPLFASLPFYLLANPPTFRSHLQCAFLGLSRWWDSYSLPDEALANGCWIMHGARI